MRLHLQDLPKIFRDTATKIKGLSLLSEFFCLSNQDLALLAYGNIDPSTLRGTRRTISLLQAEGFTDYRMLAPRLRTRGSPPIIHGLTKKGVLKVAEAGLTTPATKIFKPNSDTLLPHEYEITKFHLCLHELCIQKSLTLYWQQRDLKCTVNPDALFAITDPTKPEGQNTFYYFLEIEKTKPGNFRNGESKIMRNLGKYCGYFNSDRCEREWANFRKFRVIVVQRNPIRRTNLLKAMASKYAHRMFWLTTEEQYRLEIGGPIFLTPKDHETALYSLP